MKISINWAQYFSNVDLMPEGGVGELVRKIGAQLGEVDEAIDLTAKYKGIVIAKVVSCHKHSNADKLHVCKLDDGGVVKDVPRDESGHIQVVCGAPNVRQGLLVAWLPPGTTVPSTADKDPFVLEARELRGVISHGMLASAHELGISDDHSGIVELDEGQVGADFAATFKLNDTIVDVENKMFTHRPDCFGQLGVAREIAGIQHKGFKSPDWYLNSPSPKAETSKQLPLKVDNQLPELVPRFMAVAMSNVQVKPSPLWLQTHLSRVGIRPINNVVDLTNYYMMLTAQPLHAYDYDKLKALDASNTATLTIRHPKEGEKLTLLGGKEITPRKEAIMIASAQKLIGLGGVMGGHETEVDANTKNIVLECASFDLYSIRRTSMEHGLFTDAVTRFSKGQSALQNDRILAKIMKDIENLANGQIASSLIDLQNNLPQPAKVQVSSQFINDRLGVDLSAHDMAKLLTNVELIVQVKGGDLTVTAPFWRTDLAIPEDIVEEVGRLYGYDHLPLKLPPRDVTPPLKDPMSEFKKQIRQHLSAAGANELLTYSFVHGNLLDKVGQDKTKAFQLSNALSPDLQYYRLSLTPSLLDKVHPNLKADYIRSDDNEFALFEMNKVHRKDAINPDDGLPYEHQRLALVFAASDKTATRKYHGAAYYQAKTYLQNLLKDLNIVDQVVFEPLQPELYKGATVHQIPMYQPERAAIVRCGDTVLGEIGEYSSAVRQALKLPLFTVGFELNLVALQQLTRPVVYQALPKFPKTQQDISFKVASSVIYQQLVDVLQAELAQAAEQHNYNYVIQPLDIYQPAHNSDSLHYTWRIWLWQPERTLTTAEVNQLFKQLAQAAQQTLKAERT